MTNSSDVQSTNQSSPLRVLIPARVSDPRPGKQDERSVTDQDDLIRSWIDQNIPEPCEIEVFASSGRGEWLDRAEFIELCDKVATRQYDLVVTKDLGRIICRMHAHIFCEECVDHGVRLIAINDHVDTAQPGWEDRSIFSAWHHERSNRDTSDRIKRTHRARFQHGGCASIPIFGYIKPPHSKSDQDWLKDPDAQPIYEEWFRRLDRGDSFAEIADWLNQEGVPTGPYCEAEKWDGTMLGRVSRNPLLKGVRLRNKSESWRDSRGKYRTRKADPSMLLEREVPHLAFFSAEYRDRVINKVNKKNLRYSRNVNGVDPRQPMPRKRTRFPGQMLYCGICGHMYVFGGHGQRDHLMCDGARKHNCWNGITVDGPLAARLIGSAVLETIESLPDFDKAFLADINAEANRLDAERKKDLAQYDQRLKDIDRQLDNFVAYIGNGQVFERIRVEMDRLETERREILVERQRILETPSQRIEIPAMEELRQAARDSVYELAEESWEFCKLMRRLVARIVVFPYRLCDGGAPVLRAKFRVHASGLLDEPMSRAVLERPLEQVITLDLFNPPQRAAFRERIMNLRRSEKSERQAADECGITTTAAQRAAALQRRMDGLGITDPYLPLTAPPDDYPKLRRHLHKRYRFAPLPDAGQILNRYEIHSVKVEKHSCSNPTSNWSWGLSRANL